MLQHLLNCFLYNVVVTDSLHLQSNEKRGKQTQEKSSNGALIQDRWVVFTEQTVKLQYGGTE